MIRCSDFLPLPSRDLDTLVVSYDIHVGTIFSRHIFWDLNNLHQLTSTSSANKNKIKKILMSYSHTDPARNKRTPFDIDKSIEHVFWNRAACRGLFKVLLDWVLRSLCQTWFVKPPKFWNLVLFMRGCSNIKAHVCRFRNPEIQYDTCFGVPHWRICHKRPKMLILLSSEVQCKKVDGKVNGWGTASWLATKLDYSGVNGGYPILVVTLVLFSPFLNKPLCMLLIPFYFTLFYHHIFQ